jgi:delta(3,5)-delta(2,4)-dienoyl-CoA isomerase
MWAELRSIFERVSAEPAVRVVVLSSSLDKTWTVGLDCRCCAPLKTIRCPRHCALQGKLALMLLVRKTVTAQTALVAPAPDPARKAFQLRDHLLVRAAPIPIPASPRLTLRLLLLAHEQQDFQDAISSIQLCKQPVIAAIHGNAVGLAIDIASACDVRLAASDVTFGIFVRPGHSTSSRLSLHTPLELRLVRYTVD